MNPSASKWLRDEIKSGLAQLPQGWQKRFKLLYGVKPNTQRITPEIDRELDSKTIDTVVDEMDDDKLDWALTQVQNSLSKASSS
jgi:hypothetical protein